MDRGHRPILVAVFTVSLALVLLVTAPIAPVDASTSVHSQTDYSTPLQGDVVAPSNTTRSVATIDRTQTLSLTPERPGEITVTLRYDIPDTVTELRTGLPQQAAVVETDGFVQRGAGEFVWDRRTETPSITYRLAVNRTGDTEGPIAGRGDFTFVDTGDWALVRIPPVWSRWNQRAPTDVSRSTRVAGDGAVGGQIAFLGDHQTFTRTAHGQTFRLVVPDRASLAVSPNRVLNEMVTAANTLQVGDRDPTVFAVAAPTANTKWDVRGLQTGDADFWVRDSERLDTADNVWIHEYVHTRQAFTTSAEVSWTTEAMATYYGALLALENGRIEYETFQRRLAVGTQSQNAGAILADPTTWDGVAPYLKGTTVAADLDRRIRLASTGTASLQDVFSRMNAHPGAIDADEFRNMVRTVAEDVDFSAVDQFVSTTAAPSTWDREEHTRAFGSMPSRIGNRLSDNTRQGPFRVTGPYRATAVNGHPIPLATGETLSIDVAVINEGGTAGTYTVQLYVGEEPTTQRTGELPPGERESITLSHAFPEPGEYTLSVGGRQIPVSVRTPEPPTVVDLTASSETVAPNDTVTVSATVANDGTYPAAGVLTLTQNGVDVGSREVALAPGAERTITFERTLRSSGQYEFRLEESTVAITVEETDRSTSSQADDPRALDGFGIAVVLVGLAVSVLVIRRHR